MRGWGRRWAPVAVVGQQGRHQARKAPPWRRAQGRKTRRKPATVRGVWAVRGGRRRQMQVRGFLASRGLTLAGSCGVLNCQGGGWVAHLLTSQRASRATSWWGKRMPATGNGPFQMCKTREHLRRAHSRVCSLAGRSPHGRPPGEDAGAAEARPPRNRTAAEASDQPGPARSPPEGSDVRRILDDIRRSVLRGCVIVFSRVRPSARIHAPSSQAPRLQSQRRLSTCS